MKVRFLTPEDTSLASPDTSVLSRLRAEMLSRPDVSEAEDIQSADALVLHEPWAFREWRYIDRLLADSVVGQQPHKVYTVNSDDGATGLLRGAYSCLPRQRFDPALHAAIPFIEQINEHVMLQAGTERPVPSYLATWRGNPKSNRRLRGRLLEVCGRSAAFKVESTQSWWNHGVDEKLHFVELLRSGKFSLCPGGWAPASMRIYESMGLGVAPVLIADDFVEPPGPDWNAISLRIKEAELASIERLLEERAGDYEERGRRAHEAWQQYFRPEKLMGYISEGLLRCMRNGAAAGSREAEIARWRSRKMFESNRWTMRQRVGNRLRKMLEPAS